MRMRASGSVTNAGIVAGVVGLILFAVGVVIEPRQALTSYLFAYATVLTVVLGALIQVMMSHVTGARWFTVLRRLTLDVAGAMPALGVLALPILVGVSAIYSWTAPATLPLAARTIVARKHAWLNVPFFVGRGIVYLIVWLAVSALLRRWSLQQDRQQDRQQDHQQDRAAGAAAVAITRRLRRLSAGGLIVVGLTMTFAAFDWLMSLEPTWYSTIYGVYVFAGGFLAALALVAVVGYAASVQHGDVDAAVTPEHFGALGKLLLTFTIFWAYIAFSQFLIIWIGDVPSDVSWYVARAAGSWGTLALVIAFGQFAIPFVLLLSRALKRRPAVMAALGAWLLAMHALDVYWLVLPALHPAGIHVSWLDAASLVMVVGFATAASAWRASRRPLLPIGDPYLQAAVRYREP